MFTNENTLTFRHNQLTYTLYLEVWRLVLGIDCWTAGNKLAKAEPSGTKIILLTIDEAVVLLNSFALCFKS